MDQHLAWRMSAALVLLASTAGKAESASEQCRVASAILRMAINNNPDRDVILSDKVEAPPYPGDSAMWYSSGGSVIQAPPSYLIHKLKRASVLSAIGRCSLSDDHSGRVVKTGAVAVDQTMAGFSKNPKAHHDVIISLSMPIVSRDGKSALAYYNEVSGLTAGGAYIYYLKKNSHGVWIVAGSLTGAVA